MPSSSKRNRGRGLLAALQRDRGDAGQALEFEPDQGVLADRGVVLDQRQRDDATRIVELHGHHLAHPDTVEIDAAAVAQAGRRAFEDDAQRTRALVVWSHWNQSTKPNAAAITASVKDPIRT